MRDTIKITLSADEFVALARLAERDCRPVPMQAKHLVLEALRRDSTEDEPQQRTERAVRHADR